MLHDAGVGGLLIPDNASAPRVCDLHGRQLETASLAGDSRIVRHTAILDVIADAVPGSRTEPAHLLAHVLPQLVGRQARQGLRPDMTARTAHGQPPRHAARADRHAVWYDVKQLTAACTSSYLSGPGARSFAPGAVADRRAELVHREAVRAVRALDSTHSHLPGGGGVMYPSLQEQEERGLDGPVYRAFRAAVGEADGGVVQGLVVGSYGDTSAAVDRTDVGSLLLVVTQRFQNDVYVISVTSRDFSRHLAILARSYAISVRSLCDLSAISRDLCAISRDLCAISRDLFVISVRSACDH